VIKIKKASILLYTLLIISLITLLTQQFVRTVWVGTIFGKRMVNRQQAKALALGGLTLAISQISYREPKQRDATEKTEDKALKDLLTRVLPHINRWQVFELEKKFDGIDGQIKFCITCENGKININQAFDFSKQEFKPAYKNLFKGLSIKGKIAEGEFEKRLVEFFKKRKRKLDEISELVDVEGFEKLDVFYSPPKDPEPREQAKPNDTIFLQDLFTIWSESENIELLFVSDSLSTIFGMRRPLANDAEKLKEKFETIIKNFNKGWGADWNKNWLNIHTVYGAKPKNFDGFKQILSKQFGPKVYSVLSCGKVGDVEQRLLAVVEPLPQDEQKDEKKDEKPSEAKPQQEQTKEKKESFPADFRIIKLYWI
jgi:hypothetical protein